MINQKILNDAEQIIKDASIELEEMYSKIKKSNKLLRFKDYGQLLAEIQISTAAFFSLMQIIEFSAKAKMVRKDNKELNRKERLIECASVFKQKFESLYQQQLNGIDNNDK